MKSKRIALLLALTVMMTSVFSMPVSAAVATPSKTSSVKATAASSSSVKVTWKKAKNASGYTIYRGKNAVTSVKTTSYVDKGLKASTKYSYKVRAYKTYKQKQYYNSKTKKWVTKKPKKSQWKGKKTRTVTKKKYGKYSSVVSATTKKASAPVNYPSLDTARTQGLEAINTYVKSIGYTPEWEFDAKLNELAQEAAIEKTQKGIDKCNSYDILKRHGLWVLGDPYSVDHNMSWLGNATKFDQAFVKKMISYMGPEESVWQWTSENYTRVGIGYKNGIFVVLFTSEPEKDWN